GAGILLITEPFDELIPGGGELGKRINKASGHQRRDILHDVHQDLFLEQQMHGAPDTRIVERLSFGIEPGRVDHALVEFRSGQTRSCSRLASSNRVERTGVIHSARQNRGSKLRRKWQEMVE